MPLPIESDQRLALLQLIPAARAIVRIVVLQLLATRHVRLALGRRHCGRSRGRQLLLALAGRAIGGCWSTHARSHTHRGSDASLTEHFLARVGHLAKRRMENIVRII